MNPPSYLALLCLLKRTVPLTPGKSSLIPAHWVLFHSRGPKRYLSVTSKKPRLQHAAAPADFLPISSKDLQHGPPPLAVLSTPQILRSLAIYSLVSTLILSKYILSLAKRIAESTTFILDLDRNPLLRVLWKNGFYNHFCAGENEAEVAKTREAMRKMGFKGVIIGHGREVVVAKREGAREPGSTASKAPEKPISERELAVSEWRDANIRTVHMLGQDDILAVKYVCHRVLFAICTVESCFDRIPAQSGETSKGTLSLPWSELLRMLTDWLSSG